MSNKIKKTDDTPAPLDPLAEINLPIETQDELLLETVGSSVLSMIPTLGKVIDLVDSYKDKLNAARLALLLSAFKQKLGDLEQFQDRMERLLTTSTGLIIFQKVIRLSGASPYDKEHITLLANTLKKVSGSDFKELFEEHNYALSQIDKLSPQALLVLSEYSSWPTFTYSSSTSSGVTTGKDWETAFASKYAKEKGITDTSVLSRISHVLYELDGNKMTILERNKLALSPIGHMVHDYLI